ncbi:hypothetical protein GH714_033523 [Hevea brasiliensis]|uniref:Uncharacterized protein n=1 Tax=Hevea brasiliensis TaxID=3981 RepID=A0A6A6MR66_HEVBR|nr:hypothetical protein GH714_033523 [Hevea brasiliensis]
MSSLRDRTKDILSVVVALLFGVGCGALTAATMYLVWSLFSTRYDYRYEEFDGEDGDEEDDLSAKKMGYGKIPEAGSMPKQVKEANSEQLQGTYRIPGEHVKTFGRN